MDTTPRRWAQALRASHDALIGQVRAFTPAELEHGSFCSEWDVSQVLSHLGSGAEISLSGLERALAGAPPLDREQYPAIWDRWNALAPADRAAEMVVWDRRQVSVLNGLDDATLGSLRIPMFGMDLDVATATGFRLAEHAVHSWDIAVAFDATAELLSSSTELLVDRLGFMVSRVAKPAEAAGPRRLEVRTTSPERRFLLALEEQASLTEHGGGPVDGELELPAASLIRLVYGRLSPEHTPQGITTRGDADLSELRKVFPGF